MKYYEIIFHIAPTAATGVSANPWENQLQDVRDLIAGMTGMIGFETFEDTTDGIKGYIQTADFDEEALKSTIEELPYNGVSISYETEEAEYKDWNEEWENEGFMPIYIAGKCVIHDGRHTEDFTGLTPIEIDTKMAFGTGNHETTRMIINELLSIDLKGKTILDCGCGTGILGIVALKFGCAEALGCDIDEWSTDNTRHNAIINQVDGKYNVILGDASVLNGIQDRFDIVVANINRNILLNDMPAFKRAMKANATLIISGFYADDVEKLEARAKELGMTTARHTSDGDWHCLNLVISS